MHGFIAKFYIDKGFGFIKSKDEEFFFHCSDFNENFSPTVGINVSFEIGFNTKGKIAKNIKAQKTESHISQTNNAQQPKFINIDGTNIKLSNIKQYGIYKTEIEGKINIPNILNALVFDNKEHLNGKTVYTLYITSYQGDNYTFKKSLSQLTMIKNKLDMALGSI